jgi:hypothetical protein
MVVLVTLDLNISMELLGPTQMIVMFKMIHAHRMSIIETALIAMVHLIWELMGDTPVKSNIFTVNILDGLVPLLLFCKTGYYQGIDIISHCNLKKLIPLFNVDCWEEWLSHASFQIKVGSCRHQYSRVWQVTSFQDWPFKVHVAQLRRISDRQLLVILLQNPILLAKF